MIPRECPYALTRVLKAITTATTTEIVAAVAGKVIRVWRMRITSTSAQDLTVKSATTTLGVLQNTTSEMFPMDEYPWFTCAAGEALNLTTAGGVDCDVICDYTVGPIGNMPGSIG